MLTTLKPQVSQADASSHMPLPPLPFTNPPQEQPSEGWDDEEQALRMQMMMMGGMGSPFSLEQVREVWRGWRGVQWRGLDGWAGRLGHWSRCVRGDAKHSA